jgi:hypothetical protein
MASDALRGGVVVCGCGQPCRTVRPAFDTTRPAGKGEGRPGSARFIRAFLNPGAASYR